MRLLAHIAIRLVMLTGLGLVGLNAASPGLTAIQDALTEGDSAIRRGDYDAAISAYARGLNAKPADFILWERLYRTAIAANRREMAMVYLRRGTAQNKPDTTQFRKMGSLFDANGDHRTAIVYWRLSLDGTQADIPALRILIQAALSDRQWDLATNDLEQLLALDPTDMATSARLGMLLAPVNPSRALDLLKIARADSRFQPIAQSIDAIYREYGSELPEALAFRIGLALLNLGQWPYAEHALTTAVTPRDVAPEALAFLGLAQDYQGRDGWPPIRQALEIAPNSALANYAAGVHWRIQGQYEQALAALNLARALDSKNPAIAAEIGLTYRAQRFLPQALQWFRTAIALAPDDPRFQILLANLYADENLDLAVEGLAVIRAIVDRYPENADAQASLGWALLSSRQADSARKALQTALQLDPGSIRARFYFGVLLEYQGDLDGARDAYEAVYGANDMAGFRERAGRALLRLGYQPRPGMILERAPW